MKKIFLSLFFSIFFSAAFGQLSQFRMIGSGSWSTVNDSTFSSTVTIQSDLTANGFLPTGITDSMFIFTQTGQRYRISSAINLTFSSADLTIVESGGDWGTPVGQVMIYEDNERTAVPSIPFGATGATAKMQEAVDSYNSTLIGSVASSVDSIQHVKDTTSLTPSLGDEFVNSTKDTSGVYSTDRWLLRSGAGGVPEGLSIQITQIGHSFDLSVSPWSNYGFIPVYTDLNGLIQLAQADSVFTTATGYITAINGDILTVRESGYFDLPPSTTLNEGQYYWLSNTQPGYITDTEPDTSQVVLFVESGANKGVLLNMRVVDQSISVKTVSEGTNADTTLDLSSNNIFRLDLTGFSSAQIDFTGGQNGGNYTLQWYNNSGTMSFDTSFNCVTNLSYGQMDDITAQAGSISFYRSDTAFYSTHTLPDCAIKTDVSIVFEAQYQAVLDSATNWGFTLPDAATQVAQNAFLKALKDNLLWTELDVVYVFAVDSEDFSKINWKAVDTLTVNGSMTFTADAGWAGDGIGGYLATGKNVSAGGYAQGDASFIVDINTASSSDIFDLGTSTNGLIFGSNSSGSNYYFRMNTNSDDSFAHSGADTGFFHMNVLSGTYNLYRNGTDLGLTFTQVNNTNPSGTLDLGRRTSSYSDAQFSFCAWGVSLTGVQAGNLYTAWNTYKSSL